ncbi:MAG: T9SS type A sorting domain-containing protein [Flavobacteriales bacterium]|nr:T9SS type A sorting domain-containing protein [Flavobacteriales bacterium]
MRYFLFFIFFSSSLFAQEILSPLLSSPRINNYQISKNKNSLILPFFDDFSSNELNANKWIGNSVLVNCNYPVNPPTLGAVTFDGLDSNGFAYDINMTNNNGLADVLLSQEIDLSAVDTAFFLFYHQPQGFGDNPQGQDSLSLEFLSDSLGVKSWKKVWSVPGNSLHEFHKNVIMIYDQEFLYNSFQFRFSNIATLSGNFDHWHIDYIKLDSYFLPVDTSTLNDVAFVYEAPSFLKRYNEMPWLHFQDNITDEINDTLNILLRNNQASINVDYQYNVYENNIVIDHYPSLGISRNITIYDYDSIGNFVFENPPIAINNNVFLSNFNDSAEFMVEHIIGTGSNDYKWNDTLIHFQKFNSHFAYDDGSVESAYGINVNGAMGAYQFKLNRPDTLRAVQVYFPQMLDTVNAISFLLTVWDDNNGVPGSIIHQQLEYPKHTPTNNFHFYYLDSLFQLTGVFYVGWQQISADMLNIGLDRNSTANDYMFYNVGGGWNNSQYNGAWMIRPIVSMNNVFLSNNDIIQDVSIYPNPASNYLNIITNTFENQISLYDISGNLIFYKLFNKYELQLNIGGFSEGLYILKIQNSLGVTNRKLIIR